MPLKERKKHIEWFFHQLSKTRLGETLSELQNKMSAELVFGTLGRVNSSSSPIFAKTLEV